jgi:hypothetical protein
MKKHPSNARVQTDVRQYKQPPEGWLEEWELDEASRDAVVGKAAGILLNRTPKYKIWNKIPIWPWRSTRIGSLVCSPARRSLCRRLVNWIDWSRVRGIAWTWYPK